MKRRSGILVAIVLAAVTVAFVAQQFIATLRALTVIERERDTWQRPEDVLAPLALAPGRTIADLGSGAGQAALRENIALAEELGATVVRVRADRPADGLVAFPKREGITHVVFGQSARTRWEILLKGSTLNRFLEEVRDATIQVVPLGNADPHA